MARLILHIGMHKTGTTAIQHTLWEHRKLLKRLGYGYFSTGRNHSISIVSLFRRSPETYGQNRLAGRLSSESIAPFNAMTRARFDQSISERGDRTMIISGESIGLHLDAAETDHLLGELRPHFEDIRIIAYVRPPISFAVSSFQQRVKGGANLEQLSAKPILPSYRRRFEKFYNLLPESAITLKLYDRSRFPEGCVVRDFLQTIGVSPADFERFEIASANQSLTQPAVALLLALNDLYPEMPDGRRNADWPHRMRKIALSIGGPRFRAPAEMLQRTKARARDDAAWVSSRLGLDINDFDSPIDESGTAEALRGLAHEDMPAIARFVADLCREIDRAEKSPADTET